LPHEWQEWSS
jgi:hypothetical protein